MTRRRPISQGAALGLLGILLLAVYASTISTSWKTPDVASAEVGAWRIAHTGSPWVDGVASDLYLLSVDVDESTVGGERLILFSTINERNGHAVIGRTPGAVAAGIPAYWIEARLDPGSAEEVSPVPGALTGAAITALAVVLLLLSLRDLVSTRVLIGSGLALALTTPYWSVLADALWSHNVTVLGIAGMAWAARHDRWWLVGLFGGVSLWGRLHVALVVAVLGLGLALWRRRPDIAVVVAAVSMAALAGAFAWGRWVYGSWDLYAVTGGYAQAAGHIGAEPGRSGTPGSLTNLLGYLVSPGAGLFVWTPVLLALMPAMVRTWRSAPDWTRLLAASGIVYLVAQSMLNLFHGGTGFWGNRLGLETLTCVFPLLVCSLAKVRPLERSIALALLSYQGGLILLGAVFNIAHGQGDAWREYEPYLAFKDNAVVTVSLVAVGMALTYVVARILQEPRRPTRTEPALS